MAEVSDKNKLRLFTEKKNKCVRVCMRVCVRACMCACVCVHVVGLDMFA